MVDVLIILLIVLAILTVITFAVFISGDESKAQLYWTLGFILAILICWAVLRDLTKTQNYKIDTHVITVDELSVSTSTRTLIFNKKLTVEVTEFDMPLGTFYDFENYRIYIDSLTYIDIYSPSFDSLDLKYGKKLYKE